MAVPASREENGAMPDATSSTLNPLEVTVSTKDLSYKLISKPPFFKNSKKNSIEALTQNVVTEKYLVKNITLCAKPGEVLFIMGPSGSGKSTLLNLLAGRTREKSYFKVSGDVYFNGLTHLKDMSSLCSYVMQNEKLPEYLTVEETMSFAAALKMKNSGKKERESRVKVLIDLLGLSHVKDNYIGGSRKKGISGGEQRRVSIAIEMLDNPSVLFLDEPTTGLDASLAYDMLRIITRAAAKTRRTVICTVHQPRSQAFAMFDQLLLLSKGEVVYNGSASKALPYFESLGFPAPPRFNSADFLLDLLSPDGAQHISRQSSIMKWFSGIDSDRVHRPRSHSASCSVALTGELAAEKPHLQAEILAAAPSSSSAEKTSKLVTTATGRICISDESLAKLPEDFLMSEGYKVIQDALEESLKLGRGLKAEMEKSSNERFKAHKAVWYRVFQDISILLHRGFLDSIRNPMVSMIRLVVAVFLGLLLGGIFFGVAGGEKNPETAQNIIGNLFFVCAYFSFSALDALQTFPQDRVMFNRETANGTYLPISYFIARNINDFPFQVVPALFFGTIIYWMAGLAPTAAQFFEFLLSATLSVFASSSYMYALGTLVPEVEAAQIIAPLILIIFMLLSGFYLRDDYIPAWISWLKWLSFLRFSFFSQASSQFPAGEQFGSMTTDETLLTVAGISESNYWLYILLLFCLSLGYRVLAFIALKYAFRHIGLES